MSGETEKVCEETLDRKGNRETDICARRITDVLRLTVTCFQDE